MLSEIEQYRAGKSTLGRLATSLEVANSNLRDPGEDWVRRFQTAWWPLEEVYAISRSDEPVDETRAQDDIAKSLDELTALMTAKKS